MKELKPCIHIECEENSNYNGYCKFHQLGGVIGNGETYEQYQIIEQDFIDFIKIIPLNDDDNLKVYSPLLRDIIIRSCVQIELFFKEWGKFDCSENNNSELLKSYNEINKKTEIKKGARNWNFRDYFYLKEKYSIARPLHVRDLDIKIDVFSSWNTIDKIPEWWNVYNSIKHDGIKSKKNVNLKIALESVAALFTLHCANKYSREYLKQFSSIKVARRSFGKLNFKMDLITTPLDSKKYLFKDVYSSIGRGVEIIESEELQNQVTFKGKSV
ncbi:MAG: hypothetical protein V4670_11690 [Bacteroidota bacterium]